MLGHPANIPFRSRGFAQYLGYRLARAQPRGLVRYVCAQIHDQDSVHVCTANDLACANNTREEFDLPRHQTG